MQVASCKLQVESPCLGEESRDPSHNWSGGTAGLCSGDAGEYEYAASECHIRRHRFSRTRLPCARSVRTGWCRQDPWKRSVSVSCEPGGADRNGDPRHLQVRCAVIGALKGRLGLAPVTDICAVQLDRPKRQSQEPHSTHQAAPPSWDPRFLLDDVKLRATRDRSKKRTDDPRQYKAIQNKTLAGTSTLRTRGRLHALEEGGFPSLCWCCPQEVLVCDARAQPISEGTRTGRR